MSYSNATARLTALFTALLAVVAIVATSTSASAGATAAAEATTSSTTASATSAEDVGALISERQCNVGERPRQIALFLGISGEEGQRCFGGRLGSIGLGNAPVFDLFSGDYTGAIDCIDRRHMFRPNEIVRPNDICRTLTILPGS